MSHPAEDPDEVLTVGAFQAKTELSKLLRQARSGKRIVITQRGTPVAELGPVRTARGTAGKWGDMEGKIAVSNDFCDTLPDFREYTE